MPQQLIYTSSQRGLVAGRSGFCTVARSEGMREALVLRLEQLSYYEHRIMTGGAEQPVCACRIVDIRGSRFHVMSRIQDAGLDFTNRTNFIAHHLVFMPEELRELPVAPVVFSHWNGWFDKWLEAPRILTAENWGNLHSLSSLSHVPAQTWASITGDAVNAFALLDAASPVLLKTDGLDEQTLLRLFTESLEMMEARDITPDFKQGLWQYTFTTCLQEQDSPSDFRWRCMTTFSPALKKLAANSQNPTAMQSLRAGKCSLAEAAFARNGREPLSVTCQPASVTAQEGDTVTVRALATGVPLPNRFEWYSCARNGTLEKLIAEGSPDLVLDKVTIGMHRLAVQVANSRGETAVSHMVQVSVEKRIGIARSSMPAAPARVQKPAIDSSAKVEKKPQVWTADAEEFAKHLDRVQRNKKKRIIWMSSVLTLLFLSACIAFVVVQVVKRKKQAVRPPVIAVQPRDGLPRFSVVPLSGSPGSSYTFKVTCNGEDSTVQSIILGTMTNSAAKISAEAQGVSTEFTLPSDIQSGKLSMTFVLPQRAERGVERITLTNVFTVEPRENAGDYSSPKK